MVIKMDGERLQELRKDRGMSQKELARRLNLSEFTISSYEHGKTEPSNETLVSICDIFNVSADYLLGRTDVRAQRAMGTEGKDFLLLPRDLSVGDRYMIQRFVDFIAHD